MNFINLTPHEVVISNPYLTLSFKPSGTVTRVDMQYEKQLLDFEVTEGIKISVPVQVSPKAKVTNLPDPQEGVIYIVSSYVAQTVRRDDLVSPLTDSTAERDSNGSVLSVKSFQTYSDNVELTFENTFKEYQIVGA
jgi:hypothetical protein